MNDKTTKDLFEFQMRRHINGLCRNLLILIEDLSFEEQERKTKNQNKEIVLSEPKKQYIRKRVLDKGNDCLREVLSDLKNYEIKFEYKDK